MSFGPAQGGGGGGGGIPLDAPVAIVTADATLTAARRIVGTANQVTATDDGAGTTITFSAPQDIHTGATPTFSQLTLDIAEGTAPLIVTSTTLVSNLNADTVDGVEASAFVLLAGLSGGQTIIGDTDAAGSLTLQSNPTATRGPIIFNVSSAVEAGRFNDGTTGELLLGKTTSTSTGARLQVFRQSNTIPTTIIIENDAAGSGSASWFWATNGTNLTYYGVTGTAYTAGNNLASEEGVIFCNNTGGFHLHVVRQRYLRASTGGIERWRTLSTGEFLLGDTSQEASEQFLVNGSYVVVRNTGAAIQDGLRLYNKQAAADGTGSAVSFYANTDSGGRQIVSLKSSVADKTTEHGKFEIDVIETGSDVASAYEFEGGVGHTWRLAGNLLMSLDATDLDIDVDINHDGTNVGLYSATPVAQHSSTGETTGFTAGVGTGVNDDSTFTGNVGATAYTISDVVKALKNIGIMAQ